MKMRWLVVAALVSAAGGQSEFSGSFTVRGALSAASQGDNRYCLKGDAAAFGATSDGPAALPLACMFTGLDGTPSPGTSYTAANSTEFTSLLSSVACGDTIVLNAGTTYVGKFTLPNKACDANHWITIRSSALASLPAEGTRVTPCEIGLSSVHDRPTYTCTTPAVRMPTLTTATTNQAVIDVAAGANHYRLIGLNITKNSAVKVDAKLVSLSGGDHIIVDRSLVHGTDNTTFDPNDEAQGGVNLQGTYLAVMDSWVYDFMCMSGCTDSQAVSGGLGSSAQGPLKVANNFLEAAGETWLFGGGGGSATPADGEFRRNHSFKPLSWFLPTGGSGSHPIVKNLGECKNCERFLFEGNVFENNWGGWQGDQFGTAVLLTPKNQSSFTQSKYVVTNGTAVSCVTASGGTTACAAGTGPWAADMTAPDCPAGGCHIRIPSSGTTYHIASVTDSEHITMVEDAGVQSLGQSHKSCHPGLMPLAVVRDVTFRYNLVKHAANGAGIATAVSDCGDEGQGIHFVSVHANVFDDINGPNWTNASSPCCNGGWVFKIANENDGPTTWPNDITIAHNTALAIGFSNGIHGLMYETDFNSNGPTAATYFKNVIVQDNAAPTPYAARWGNGTAISGGALGGLNQVGCPAHDGLNCTWTLSKNLLAGPGVFGSQITNTPYPSSNQTCGTGGQTCFPTDWTGIFANYNAGNGGDYHLAAGSPYKNAGTDGKDLGADVDKVLQSTAGVN